MCVPKMVENVFVALRDMMPVEVMEGLLVLNVQKENSRKRRVLECSGR